MNNILYGNTEYGIPTERELNAASKAVQNARRMRHNGKSRKSTLKGIVRAAKMLAISFAKAVEKF